jgi:hypothetical protein
MKRFNIMNTRMKPMVLACALAAVAGQAGAQDYYLAAKAFTKTMPDGSTVPMWGYVEDAGGACYTAATPWLGWTASMRCRIPLYRVHV